MLKEFAILRVYEIFSQRAPFIAISMEVKNLDAHMVQDGMHILGIDLQTIFLYGLIIGGSLTLLYMLFGDVFDVIGGIGDVSPGSILNPTVILSFIAVFCGAGYVLELREMFGSGTNLLMATLIAIVIVGLIHFFILVPLAKSEQNTAQSIKDFLHKRGEVITTIPERGVGEVLIQMDLGVSGHVARSSSNTRIAQGTLVTVVAIKENDVLIVEPLKK